MKKKLLVLLIILLVSFYLFYFIANNGWNNDNKRNRRLKSITRINKPFKFTVSPYFAIDPIGESDANNKDLFLVTIHQNSIIDSTKSIFMFQLVSTKLLDKYVDEDGYFPQTFTTKEKRVPQLIDNNSPDNLVKIKTKFLNKELYRIKPTWDGMLDIVYYELYKEEDGKYYYDYPLVDNEYQVVLACGYTPPLPVEEMDERLMKEEMEKYLEECDRIVESVEWVGWDE